MVKLQILIVLSFCLLLSVPLKAEEISPKDLACFNAFWNYNERGIGTTKEAFDICVESAKAGARGAQNAIAEGYLGAGDKDKALYWFKKSAGQGHQGAWLRVQEIKNSSQRHQ